MELLFMDPVFKEAAPTKYYVKEGSNLFFEMKKDGKAIDPMAYLPAISE